MTDWNLWRKCRVCRADIGVACRTLSGRIINGRPDGIARYMLVPHKSREPRKIRRKHLWNR